VDCGGSPRFHHFLGSEGAVIGPRKQASLLDNRRQSGPAFSGGAATVIETNSPCQAFPRPRAHAPFFLQALLRSPLRL
jgi:hypothetical protein